MRHSEHFDIHNQSAVCEELLSAFPFHEPAHPSFTQEDFQQLLGRCKPGKAPGPDGIPAKGLKLCAMELSAILHSIFCQSYRTASIPTSGKHPAPSPAPCGKTDPEHHPASLSDHSWTPTRAKRGTEDAVACLLHPLLQHLESAVSFPTVLFGDFISTFNPIQQQQMMKKAQHPSTPHPLDSQLPQQQTTGC
ncbi:hypothetical protein D5F01_LYC23898 [Larimichthys crocea]|uniref:Uncharacterized protein n=1 Tax=Larimichthys crocea TaxID=215358 RepID=A0A6G0HGD2_LARCR|nr:hypothetical protein D5F01_LYC23898 [Larimichthys crocea]